MCLHAIHIWIYHYHLRRTMWWPECEWIICVVALLSPRKPVNWDRRYDIAMCRSTKMRIDIHLVSRFRVWALCSGCMLARNDIFRYFLPAIVHRSHRLRLPSHGTAKKWEENPDISIPNRLQMVDSVSGALFVHLHLFTVAKRGYCRNFGLFHCITSRYRAVNHCRYQAINTINTTAGCCHNQRLSAR